MAEEEAEKATENVITKLARFIVDKRNAFYMIFLAATIFCISSINKVIVNEDITAYLPSHTETRRGLTLMDEEFVTYGSAQVMIANITYKDAKMLCKQLEKIAGVSSITFDDTQEHYKNSSALFSISFEKEKEALETIAAMEAVRAQLEGYDVYVSSIVGLDTSANLQKEMGVILGIAAVVIVAVLLFTSISYMEVAVFFIVFFVSAVLNMGTNYWFGSISFITNAIAVVLQLALAIDYAIIFCHRYMEERENGLGAREADIVSLSKAIVEISSSSLTTISGLIALMLMQLKIGFDMGIVLAKGIVFSMLTVFLLMPGLLMLFNKPIEKTRHKNLVPDIKFWGKMMVKLRFVLPAIFLVTLIGGIFFSNRCAYVFSVNADNSGNKPDYRIEEEHIIETFGEHNTIAMLVPKGDYEAEKAILKQIGEFEEIRSTTGLAGIEVEDGRMLTDRMKPRQFAELAGVDIELARLLYQAYGLSVEEYGAIFQDTDAYAVPLVEIFQFLFEQMDKGVVKLADEQQKTVDELRATLEDGLKQLQGENWTRLVFDADVPEESEETFALLDRMRQVASRYYGDNVILVGNSTNAKDLGDSFAGDNMKISILTVLFVIVVLLFTFKSVGLPLLLVLTIQGSIWINFSFPYLTDTTLFFLSYLIISAIQMGATIDYAIVITNRYMELKISMDKKQAIVESINQSFSTVLTSGSIMTVAGFLIGKLSTDTTISSIGMTLGRGTLISIILVMTVLPQILLLGDSIIERTAITLNKDHKCRFDNGILKVDGHIRGHVSGFVDSEIKGVIYGSVDAYIESKDKRATQDKQDVGDQRMEEIIMTEQKDSESIEQAEIEISQLESASMKQRKEKSEEEKEHKEVEQNE